LRGKPWCVDEERRLRLLLQEGKSFREIAEIMGKSLVSVKAKSFNLGLKSVVVATDVLQNSVASSAAATSPLVGGAAVAPEPVKAGVVSGVKLELAGELPTVKEELKILAAAVDALNQPGLSRSEASRLQKVIFGVKAYQELFVKAVNYEGLEKEVLELRKRLGEEIDRNRQE
jgi:hypothetical protein